MRVPAPPFEPGHAPTAAGTRRSCQLAEVVARACKAWAPSCRRARAVPGGVAVLPPSRERPPAAKGLRRRFVLEAHA